MNLLVLKMQESDYILDKLKEWIQVKIVNNCHVVMLSEKVTTIVLTQSYRQLS